MTAVAAKRVYAEENYAATPTMSLAFDEMDKARFDTMLQKGLNEAEQGISRPAADVFAAVRKELL